MARIWQEGFEDGIPNVDYLEGIPDSQFIKNTGISHFPNLIKLSSSRNILSSKSIQFIHSYLLNIPISVSKLLTPSLNSLYFRVHFKPSPSGLGAGISKEVIWFSDSGGNKLLSIYNDTTLGSYNVYVKKVGVYTNVHNFTLSDNVWYMIDIYFKINSSTGEYEVKLNNVSIKAESNINTGSADVASVNVGMQGGSGGNSYYNNSYDDIALNDTTGSVNNSWCGNGTIVSLKPKASGNKSQWDTSQGYALAESGSGTTTIKITGHGLATNDVIYNKTRGIYSIVTVVDVDTLTTASITSQAQNDVILLYNVQATISATATTSTSQVTLVGHNLTSGDVIVNTTRSNAIRRVIYVNGNVLVNSYVTTANGTLGSTVTSQVATDSIKTFKFKPYAITNHWSAVSNTTDPSPKLSYIKSTTSGDIDTFDMEELVLNKGFSTNAQVIALSHNIYAQESGAGSQIKPVFRIGATDYEGSAISLDSGTLQYQTIYETSPATSTAFTLNEVDGLEAGVKLV